MAVMDQPHNLLLKSSFRSLGSPILGGTFALHLDSQRGIGKEVEGKKEEDKGIKVGIKGRSKIREITG